MKKSKKHNRLLTNSLRTLKKAFPRFLSLMLMSALGVFVFAGLTATAPDMIESLDRYLDGGNGYDLRVVSDLGLTESDVKAMQSLPEIELAEGIHSVDVACTVQESQIVMRVASLPDTIYRPELLTGRMPKGKDEIVVEPDLLSKLALKLGDHLQLSCDALFCEEVTIVGTVDCAMYYECVENRQERGNTNVGSGTVNYYGYMAAEAYDQDYFTAIYATAVGAASLVTNSSEYLAISKASAEALENIAESREAARYEQLTAEGQEKIDEAIAKRDKKLGEATDDLKDAKTKLQEAKKKLSDGKLELSDAKQKLADGKKEIAGGENQISAGEKKLAEGRKQLALAKKEIASKEKTLAAGKKQLDAAEKKLKDARKKLKAGKKKLNTAKKQLTAGQAQLSEGKETLAAVKKQIEQGKAELEKAKSALDAARQQIDAQKAQLVAAGYSEEIIAGLLEEAEQTYAAKKTAYDTGIASLQQSEEAYRTGKLAYDKQKKIYESKKSEYETQLAVYKKKLSQYKKSKAQFDAKNKSYEEGVRALAAGKKQVEEATVELRKQESKLEAAKSKLQKAKADYEKGQKDYEEGLETYEKNEKRYEKNLKKYEDARKKYEKEKKKADKKIADAEKKLAELEPPNWTVYERKDDATYNDYIQDAQSIENLALIFPVVFFLVAILVSLISMNRMVEDDRLEIGTLKSMGFSNGQIRMKYILFSLSATVVGGLLGAMGGLYIIPSMIFNIYRILFDVPGPVLLIHPSTTLLGFLLSVLCVCGTSILTANLVLKEKPSELMRPKAPKNGRKILLERIPVLWHRIRFSDKITIRNLFRYKKRVMITVGGIIGCTALMLIGFGIRDSIVDIPNTQFGKVFTYDGTVYLYDLEIGNEKERIAEIMNQPEIASYTSYEQLRFTCGDKEGYIIALEDQNSLESLMDMRSLSSGEPMTLPENIGAGEVILSDKLADMLGLSVGDSFTCQDLDQNTFHLKVGGVCENYVQNYIFMDYQILNQVVDYAPNMACFSTTHQMNTSEQDDLARRMLEEEEVLNVSFTETLVESVGNMLKSLNSVVLILVVLSAVLSFVVLYNLANINISERKREIATLKVLGFYDKEVDRYITKETIFTTLVGIWFGLLLGKVLSRIVVATIEVDMARFINEIKPISYVYAAAFSILFTWIVNRIIHFALKKIDMIDSLKSVE